MKRFTPTTRLPLLILAGALLVLFHRVLLGEVLFWGLPTLQFYPWREYAFDLLRVGQLPLWNPYNGGGAPLLANYQTALLYPLNWLGLMLPLAWTMSVTAILHLFIAGCGMWVFTGRLGISALGRGVAALGYALTGYLVARLWVYPTVFAAAWIPWLLWAVAGVLEGGRRRDVAWLAVVVALQLLVGHAQTTWYGLLLAGAYALWETFSSRPILWRRLVLAGVGIGLGAAIAAAQLLPTVELLLTSQRSGGVEDRVFAFNFSYSPARTLNLLSANIFGSPADGSYITEEGAYFEDAVYVGLLTLIAAAAAVLAAIWGRLRHVQRPAYWARVPLWGVVVVVGFALALGASTPIFPFLYDYMPTFSMFQAPVRWHIWTVFGLCILAGIGVDAWSKADWVRGLTRRLLAGLIAAVAVAILVPQFLPAELAAEPGLQAIVRAVLVTGSLGIAAGVLTLTMPMERTGRAFTGWQAAVWLTLAVDLVIAGWGLNPTVAPGFFDRPTLPGVENVSAGRGYWTEASIETRSYYDLLPFEDYRVAVERQADLRRSELPNLNLLDRQPLLNNFDPLLVRGHAELMARIERSSGEARGDLLRRAGVSHTYTDAGVRQPLTDPPLLAWFVRVTCQDQAISATMLEPDARAALADFIPLIVDAAACPAVAFDAQNTARIESVVTDGGRVTVQVAPGASGWLVVAVTDYPGWTAMVDEQAAAIERAHLGFRAVYLPENARNVEMLYQPHHWWAGVLISLAALLVTVVLFRSKGLGTGAKP